MFTDADIHQLVLSIVYSGVGVVVFAVAFLLMVKLAPFSVQKEIEEDQIIIVTDNCLKAVAEYDLKYTSIRYPMRSDLDFLICINSFICF